MRYRALRVHFDLDNLKLVVRLIFTCSVCVSDFWIQPRYLTSPELLGPQIDLARVRTR